jgi:hypothetical protein
MWSITITGSMRLRIFSFSPSCLLKVYPDLCLFLEELLPSGPVQRKKKA